MTFPEHLSLAQTAHQIFQAMEAGEKVAVIAVVAHPDASKVGRRILALGNETLGSLGDPVADRAALELAQKGLSGDPGCLCSSVQASRVRAL